MKRILILGGGTAGTIMANKLRSALGRGKWNITIVDREKAHYYQPGFLFIPFGIYNGEDVIKTKNGFISNGVDVIYNEIEKVDARSNRVFLNTGIRFSDNCSRCAVGHVCHPWPA